MHPDTSHHIRNGLSGIYFERNRLLTSMLEIAELLASKKRRKLPKRMRYLLHANLIEQMGCVRNMNVHLKRILVAERREAA